MRVGEALKQLVMKTYPFRSPYQDEGDLKGNMLNGEKNGRTEDNNTS